MGRHVLEVTKRKETHLYQKINRIKEKSELLPEIVKTITSSRPLKRVVHRFAEIKWGRFLGTRKGTVEDTGGNTHW